MTNEKTITQGITIIYFNEPHKNIYATLPVDKEQAKRLSRRIFKDAMTTISTEKGRIALLCKALAE